jgi:hypothetical protein
MKRNLGKRNKSQNGWVNQDRTEKGIDLSEDKLNI